LGGLGDPELINGRSVSEGRFETLGFAPEIGRWFTPEAQKPGVDRAVMLSHGFWVRKMGPGLRPVGSMIIVNPSRVSWWLICDKRPFGSEISAFRS
jgi:hypothetical protein